MIFDMIEEELRKYVGGKYSPRELKIATNVDGSIQTESSMFNTYIHECTHAILDTMGRGDLSQDETFVSTFDSFTTEGIVSILEQLKK